MKLVKEDTLKEILKVKDSVVAPRPDVNEAKGADWLKELKDFEGLGESVEETFDEDQKDRTEDGDKENAKKIKEVKQIAGAFEGMLQRQLEEKGKAGVLRMMFIMQLAAEGLILDHEKHGYDDFIKDKTLAEEDFYRLRRFLRDALDATQLEECRA